MSLLIAPSIPEKMSAYTLLQHSSPLSLLPVSQVDRLGSRHRGPQQGVCVCVCMCGGALMDKHHPPTASLPHSSLYISSHTPIKTEAAPCSRGWLGADRRSVKDKKS